MELKSFDNKKKFYLIIIIFILWMIVSSYWYICGVKNICEGGSYSSSNTASIFDASGYNLNDDSFLRLDLNKNVDLNKDIDININRDININSFLMNKVDVNSNINNIVNKKVTCSLYIKSYLTVGVNNNFEVKRLQSYLNKFENENLVVNGLYGSLTQNAVVRLQKDNIKNGDSLIWGSIGKYTRDIINKNICLEKAKR